VRVGIDIGRVIIGGSGPGDTSFFSSEYLETPAVPDAFEGVRQLVDENGWDNVYLISKCGSQVQHKTMHWLEHHDFWRKTGVAAHHDWMFFVRERRDKAPLARELRLDRFIDDRWDVLKWMQGSVPHLSLFGRQKRNTWNYLPFREGERVGTIRRGLVGHYPSWAHIMLED
jgi:hypothetical protein